MFRRVVTVFIAVAVLVLVALAPASAGEAGRHCAVYHHLGDPNSPWGFTVCVKVEHDPNTHSWRANGSVSTTTAGEVLNPATVRLYMDDGHGLVFLAESKTSGSSTTGFLSVQTPWDQCNGAWYFAGEVIEDVTWPDGHTSATTYTWTDNGFGSKWVYGTC